MRNPIMITVAAGFRYFKEYPLTIANILSAAEEARRERCGLLLQNNWDVADWIDGETFRALLDPLTREEAAEEIGEEYGLAA